MLTITNLVGFGARRSDARILTGSLTASGSDGTNGSSFTFSSLSIGAADASRLVVVAVAGTLAQISSVTVGGNSATKVVDYGVSSQDASSSIWTVAIPTGTTADVVVTLGASEPRCGIGVYRIVSDTGAIPTVDATDGASEEPASGGDITASVSHAADKYVIAVATGNDGNAATWDSPFTKDLDTDYGGESHRGSTASYSTTTDGTANPVFNCTDTNLYMAVASFT